MTTPPPSGGRPAGAIRSGGSWRQSSPVQTPECTTRTLAFDSTASRVRAKKRRRRMAQSAAFITTRRPLTTEEEEEEEAKDQDDKDQEQDKEKEQMTSKRKMKMEANVMRHSTVSEGDREDNIKAHESLLTHRKTLELSRGLLLVQDNRQKVIERLRHLVKKCCEQHHAATALFYADKLVTMSPRDKNDVLLFADACYLNREYHRAIHAIKQARLVEMDGVKRVGEGMPCHVMLQAARLLGKCMLAIKQKDECLELLGAILPEREEDVVLLAKKVQLLNVADPNAQGINVVSSLALLMGETFEATGNRENAMVYFRIALRCDVQCTEAFFHLFDKEMLSPQEEKELVASLDFSSDEMQLLELLYQTHVGKYNSTRSVDETFTEVEHRFGLADNLDLNVMKAKKFYYRHDIQQAHELCERVCEEDPFNFRVISVYVGTLVELGKKRELYHYAHQMVDVYPTRASAWYTVGCYYLLIQKYEAAQRYFHKATSLEPSYAPAWIGFGNSFAAQDESDQAMSSYRTASSLFPGSHLPSLYIGMEYLRTNNLVQAQEFIRQASVICPTDPLVYNELGSVFYRQEDYPNAIEMFTKALHLCKGLPERLMEAWEPTLFNLGYSYRKLRKFDQAIHYFQSALRLSPRNASSLAALGFTYHMKGCLEQAIETYHAALACSSEDTLAGSMITVAFGESLSGGLASFPEFAKPPPKDAPMTSGLTPLRVRRSAAPRRQRTSLPTHGPNLQQPRTQSTVSVLELDFPRIAP
ncbi:unnamed protein product [Peronospora farinosa]|uniref:Anaphase-promoting complex subunit 6 n=1 Tax=Peronospora farinosa TaxID=134698 RepID=A0AAV0T7U3_9STRA|nr:unnamed protein product [Peronospora farinosa]CAI5716222.1 unnamed protein product [Peronospora farinosa]